MQKYNFKKVMVTKIDMKRWMLITKEQMEVYCEGNNEFFKESINDDLDFLFEDLRLGEEDYPPDYPAESFVTYFLPKLTNEELKMVERKDENFMDTFDLKMDADVSKTKMEASESNSKFVNAWGFRSTFKIENS